MPENGSWINTLKKVTARWEVSISAEQAEFFEVYIHELLQWNQKINLTALREPEHIALGHFADSLAALSVDSVFSARNARAVDIGSGAGFPGLPIKIMNGSWHMTLLESISKRCDFLRAACAAMEMNHVDIIYKRCEEVGNDKHYRETFDFAFARALAGLSTLIEYSMPLLKVGGILVAHRGRTAAEEATRVNNALFEMGASLAGIHHYEIPGLGGSRALVVIRKEKPTSKYYPRRVGVAAKRPL